MRCAIGIIIAICVHQAIISYIVPFIQCTEVSTTRNILLFYRKEGEADFFNTLRRELTSPVWHSILTLDIILVNLMLY